MDSTVCFSQVIKSAFARYHWVTARRSAIIQTSPVHTGRCSGGAAAHQAAHGGAARGARIARLTDAVDAETRWQGAVRMKAQTMTSVDDIRSRACDFVSVLRRSPAPARAAQAFHQALLAAHGSPKPFFERNRPHVRVE